MTQALPGDAPSAPPATPADGGIAITPRHYQAICGLALGAIFLIQLQSSSSGAPLMMVANLFVLFLGTVGTLYRVRLAPILVLVAFSGPQLFEQYQLNQMFNPDFRGFRFLDVADLVLCMAMLTYLIGQYRLHSLWFGILPRDPRVPEESQRRSGGSLNATELSSLIFPIPIAAILAELSGYLLSQQFGVFELQPRPKQLLVVAWVVLLLMFVGSHGFRYWRRLQMDSVSAQLLLQDTLWQQTRGEQRRIHRWLAWQKLRK